MELEIYKKILKENGYKLTPQRLAIIDVFLKTKGDHLSIEEIYKIVSHKNSDIGLATVYRTAQLLEELEIITSLTLENGKQKYELYQDAGRHNHHHIICNNCGFIGEFRDDLLEELEERIGSEHEFQITDHKLKFYGVCSTCTESELDNEKKEK